MGIVFRSLMLAAAGTAATICQGLLTSARAQSLEETLAATYRSNPILEAARARLRGIDEEVPLASTGYHPTIQADAIAGRRRIETQFAGQAATGDTLGLPNTTSLGGATDPGTSSPVGWQVSGRQTIFDGFRTDGAINKAHELVRAGRAELETIQANVLLDAAIAHLDLVREQRHLEIRRSFVDLLKRELQSVGRRRAAQEATNADVAITEARLAEARGALATSEGGVLVAQARYAEVVGAPPAAPLPVKSIDPKLLPVTIDDVLRQARVSNPGVVAAIHRERAATHAITEAEASLLPQLTLEGSYSEVNDPTVDVRKSSEALIYGRVTVPIYEAGAPHIRIRQARHEKVARGEEMRRANLAAVGEATAAWQSLGAAKALLTANSARENAARTAIAGIRREVSVGARTQIDILNAEQEVLAAKIATASARRDQVASQLSLLKALGRLDIVMANEFEIAYDPAEHLSVATNKWLDTSVEPARAWQASFTAPSIELQVVDGSSEPEHAEPIEETLKKQTPSRRTMMGKPTLRDMTTAKATEHHLLEIATHAYSDPAVSEIGDQSIQAGESPSSGTESSAVASPSSQIIRPALW